MAGATIYVSLIGGQHQFLHIVPVAAALSHRAKVRAFVLNADDAIALQNMLSTFGAAEIEIIILRLPSWLENIGRLLGYSQLKAPQLLYWHRQMRNCDLLLTTERTSTLLKKLPGRQPIYAHIPHGAGDRAKGFEKRLRHFDYIIAAGPKDKRRMVTEKLVSEDRIEVSGYIKLAALRRIQNAKDNSLFPNDKPIILYNPHFNMALSSWQQFGRSLIEIIQADGRYNLIVAPHVRMFEEADESDKAEWLVYADPNFCIIDLGSEHCMDMSYTEVADLYIGDVSSQIYEFQAKPRPCLFLNAHNAQWRGNPDYQMWDMGQVLDNPDGLVAAIDAAFAGHANYVKVQKAMVEDALGPTYYRAHDVEGDAIDCAANIILSLIPSQR